jgi:hypothetical protein
MKAWFAVVCIAILNILIVRHSFNVFHFIVLGNFLLPFEVLEMENDEKEPGSEAPPNIPPPEQPNLTDWNSPNNPEDPHNWSFGKKAYHAGVTAIYAFTTYEHSPYISPRHVFLLMFWWTQLAPSCLQSTPLERTKLLSGLAFQQPCPC